MYWPFVLVTIPVHPASPKATKATVSDSLREGDKPRPLNGRELWAAALGVSCPLFQVQMPCQPS